MVFLQPTDNGTNEITKLKVEVPSDSSSKIYIVINWPQDNYKFDSGSLTIDNSFPANRVINNFYNLTSDLSSPDITSNAISIDSGHGINFGTILAPHNNVKLDSDTSADVNVATGGILTLNCDTLNPSNQFAITNFPKLDVIPTINSVEFEGNDTTSSDRTVSTSGSSATLTGATYGESVTADVNVSGPLNGYNLFESFDGGNNWSQVTGTDDSNALSTDNSVTISGNSSFNKNSFTFSNATSSEDGTTTIGGNLIRSNTVEFKLATSSTADPVSEFIATVNEENALSATVPATIDFGSVYLGSVIGTTLSKTIDLTNSWKVPANLSLTAGTLGNTTISDIGKILTTAINNDTPTQSLWDNTASQAQAYSYSFSNSESSISWPINITLANSVDILKEVSVGTTYEIPLTWTITVDPSSSSSSSS